MTDKRRVIVEINPYTDEIVLKEIIVGCIGEVVKTSSEHHRVKNLPSADELVKENEILTKELQALADALHKAIAEANDYRVKYGKLKAENKRLKRYIHLCGEFCSELKQEADDE